MKLFILFIISISCSTKFDIQHNMNSNTSISEFTYTDFSGTYIQKRELKVEGSKLIIRSKIYSGAKEVESTVSVSKIGNSKNSKTKYILPSISQFKVWFNKQEYFSQLKIDRKKRVLNVFMKSPEKKWQGEKEFKLPKATYICFFSQLPECLERQGLLLKAARKDLGLYVIWDNFPYHTEQLSGISEEPFFYGTLKLDGYEKKTVKYSLDIGNQIISFHFDKNLKYNRMFWVSQGISSISSQKE